ncbi:MAG: DUF692 family protein [Proteobacteria bacterium]|nr:DUF692 family protein [Pseudomonadota bacterium]
MAGSRPRRHDHAVTLRRGVGAFGVGLRRPHFEQLEQLTQAVDFVEIVSENFFRFGGRPRQVLESLRGRLPIIPHGVGLSIGGPDPLSERYLDDLDALLRWLDPPWFSDHLSYSSAFGVEYHDLIPLPFTEQAVRQVVQRIQQVQRRLGRPFMLENPSYYLRMPGAEMTEAEFLTEVVERADCGLLLDVNNVYVNATNHRYDAAAFIDAMPTDRVWQLHMAGHDASGEFLVDTHGSAIVPAVLQLYEHTLRRLGPTWTLVEWDHDVPPLALLLAESERLCVTASRILAEPPAGAAHASPAPTLAPPKAGHGPPPDAQRSMQTMHALLRGQTSAEAAAAVLGAPLVRLRAYQRFVRAHVQGVLDKNYPTLRALLGEARWQPLCAAYFAQVPAQEAELNAAAEQLPAFIEAQLAAGASALTAFHAELALVEWEEFAAYVDPARIPAPGELQHLALNPTLRALQLRHAVGSFLADWRAWERGERAAAPPEPDATTAGETVFVLRDPITQGYRTCVADAALLLAFKAAHDQLTVPAAAALAGVDQGRVERALAEATALGVLVAPTTAPAEGPEA